MGARYYDPVIGRFLSMDPVEFTEANPASFNRYAYANNNPYMYFDPDGQFPLVLAAPAIPPLVKSLGIAAGGLAIGGIIGDSINDSLGERNKNLIFSDSNGNDSNQSQPDGGQDNQSQKPDPKKPQDKKLTTGEIKRLEKGGYHPHDLKPRKKGSRYDLFKDKKGEVFVKPKKGNGPGDSTGLNINDF